MNGNRVLPYRVTLRVSTHVDHEDGGMEDGWKHEVYRVSERCREAAEERARRYAKADGYHVLGVVNIERVGG